MSEDTRQDILSDMAYYQECGYPAAMMLDIILGDYALSKSQVLDLYNQFVNGPKE